MTHCCVIKFACGCLVKLNRSSNTKEYKAVAVSSLSTIQNCDRNITDTYSAPQQINTQSHNLYYVYFPHIY
jgi:hypothetical protein